MFDELNTKYENILHDTWTRETNDKYDACIMKIEGKQEEIDGVKCELSNHADSINFLQTQTT